MVIVSEDEDAFAQYSVLYRLLLFPLRRFAHKAPKRKGMPLELLEKRKLHVYEYAKPIIKHIAAKNEVTEEII